MDLERSGTFIIRINPAGGRRTTQKDPLSKTTDTGHISVHQSKSFEWSDLTGRVVVKAWPGNIPRDARDGVRDILEPVEQMAGPEDLFDAHYLQHRVRRWLAGEAREIRG